MSQSNQGSCAVRDLTVTLGIALALLGVISMTVPSLSLPIVVAIATFGATGANIAMRRAWPAVFNPRPS